MCVYIILVIVEQYSMCGSTEVNGGGVAGPNRQEQPPHPPPPLPIPPFPSLFVSLSISSLSLSVSLSLPGEGGTDGSERVAEPRRWSPPPDNRMAPGERFGVQDCNVALRGRWTGPAQEHKMIFHNLCYSQDSMCTLV